MGKMAWGKAVRITLTEAEQRELETRSRRRKIGRADATRAQIILCAAEGLTNLAIAERLGVTRLSVALWRRRFAETRLDGLSDEPRPGAPRRIGDEDRRRGDDDAGDPAERCHTVEHALDGESVWRIGLDRAPDLARLLPAAAQERDLQALHRSALGREGARHRRSLSRPARTRSGPLRRREDADSGARPHPAPAATAPRPS